MSLEIKKGEKPAGGVVADRRLYLTADKSEVVEANDKRAAFLFSTEGTEVSGEQFAQLGLAMKDGRIVLPSKKAAAAPPPNPQGDQAGDSDTPPPAPAKAKGSKRAKKGG